MALRGCLRCIKYLVFMLNFIIWLTGLAMLGMALFLLMDPFTNHVITTSQTLDVRTYYITCYILIGASGVMTFVGFLGCCSAFQESRCMLGTFFACMLLLLTVQVIAAAYAFLHRDEVHKPVPERLTHYVQTVYGKEPYSDEPVDYIQRTLRCCGVSSVEDWRHSWWHSQNNHNYAPASCCVNQSDRVPVNVRRCGTKTDWLGNGRHRLAWKEGCADVLIKHLKDRMLYSAIALLAITCVQVLSLSLSIALCCGLRREAAGGYKS